MVSCQQRKGLGSNLKLQEIERKRRDYKLNENSVVFDVGGYKGDFTNDIYNKYKCNICVFEPIKGYFEKIDKRFRDNDKIQVYNYGLSDENRTCQISVCADSSSIYKNTGSKEEIHVYNVVDVFSNLEITTIDLMKINVEGSEYDILPKLIDSDLVEKVNNLQIQFHHFVENAETKRKIITKLLKMTHTCDWCEDWVWESWSKKG